MCVNLVNARKILGIELSADDVVDMLHRVRLGAEKESNDKIAVLIPAYRIDILHEVDIIENIAIGYCIRKIKAELPEIATVAYPDISKTFENRIREIMIGMGFYEVMSLMLTK
jgi:phenylalanyl-tRNA synthetase beta chain